MKGNAIKDITGQRFGRLIAIEATDEKRHHTYIWRCRCDCGREHLVSLEMLRQGLVQSCGCLARESRLKKPPLMRAARAEKTQIDGTDLCKLSTKPEKRSQSGVRGVCPDAGKYRAYITFQGRRRYLGRFEKLEDAAHARKEAEERLWGDFFNKHPEIDPPWERK